MLNCLVMCELVRTLQEMGDNKLGNDHSKNTDRNMEDVCVCGHCHALGVFKRVGVGGADRR